MSLPTLSYPTYEVQLISTKKTVKYRPFLVKEQKILLSMEHADAKEISKMIKELVDVCTFEKLDMKKIPYFDIENIFMKIRAKSIGEEIAVNVNCKCGNKIPSKFNIDELQVVEHPNHSKLIDLGNEYYISMNYPSIDDTLAIFEKGDSKEIIELIINCMESIVFKDQVWLIVDQTKEEVQEFLDNLTSQQFKKIEEFFKTSPKIVQDINVDCDKCNAHINVTITGLHNFFV